LHQAKITIDMILMIQKKTAGNLSEDEKRLVDNIVMDLQMNFVDERSRGDSEGGGTDGEDVQAAPESENAGEDG